MIHSLLALAGFMAALALVLTGSAIAEPAPDALAGKRQFFRCVACHSVSSTSRPLTGPHLEGIVGRQVATVEGFTYTEALRAKDFIWDEARPDHWLKAPQADIPSLCLPFTGLSKAQDRAALIAYLKNPESAR